MKCYMYVRRSTSEQGRSLTTSQQRKELKRLIRKNGGKVVTVEIIDQKGESVS